MGTVTASLYVSGSKCKEGLHDYGNPDCVFRGTSDEGQPGYYTIQYSFFEYSCGSGGTPPTMNDNGTPTLPNTGSGGTITMPNQNNPCEKIKEKFLDIDFREKYDELNESEVFNLNHEKSYLLRYPPLGTNISATYFPIDMPACSTTAEDAVFPSNSNGLAGLIHTHNNEDCNGNIPVKAPSPADIKYFLNTLLPQANQYTGSYSNAYSITMTSEGNYILVYTGTNYPGSLNYDTVKQLKIDYKDQFQYLYDTDKATQPNIEREFLKFMKEKINKPGLEVYKITSTSAKKLEYDPNSPNSVKEIHCL